MADNTSPINASPEAALGGIDQSPLATSGLAAGFIAPVIGRTALREVKGNYNLPFLRKGDTVAEYHVVKAQAMGKLYELIAATELT